ncbi:hypothetical protein Ancab_005533 [Ancistrocladus abbreviatus]
MDTKGVIKNATSDSLSRIPYTSEEMHRVRSEKDVHRSGDIHATSKEGGYKPPKPSCHSLRLGQDKQGSACDFDEPSVQRFPQEKVEHSHRSRSCSGSEIQAFQRDGHSGDSSPLFQVQNSKEHRGNCFRQQSLSSQNRKKLPMLLGVRRRQPGKGKQRRQKEKVESVSSS